MVVDEKRRTWYTHLDCRGSTDAETLLVTSDMSRIFHFVLLLFQGTFACSSLQQLYPPPILSSDIPFHLPVTVVSFRVSPAHKNGFKSKTAPVSLIKFSWQSLLSLPVSGNICVLYPSSLSIPSYLTSKPQWPRQLLKELVGMTSATTHPRRRHER
jgi:hypothetical protein